MNSFPFESKNTGTAAEPVWDRAITAEMERQYNKTCYTNGVFASPADGLMVSAMNGMSVKINPGGCHIEGARAYEASQREMTLSAASNTLPRIDRIVCRFDTAEDKRNIEIYLKEGVPATNPSPQDVIRESNYYEIVLADIYVPKGAGEVTNSNITDQRLNPELCGLVVPAIPYDNQTAELWKQISESIDLVNAALDETIAGNLQAQITNVDNRLSHVGMIIHSTTLDTEDKVKAIYGANTTWVKIEDCFLYGSGAKNVGTTGGEETHTLTVAEMPRHDHGNATITGELYNVASQAASQEVSCHGAFTLSSGTEGHGYAVNSKTGHDCIILNASHTHSTNGTDMAHNNMPPFRVVHMWERTA